MESLNQAWDDARPKATISLKAGKGGGDDVLSQL